MNIRVVGSTKRNNFLLSHFNNPLFDLVVFHIADHMLENYDGGYWDYVEADNDVAFLTLSGSDTLTLKNIFSGEKTEVDSVLGGMILTSFALLHIIEGKDGRAYVPLHTKLVEAISNYCAEIGRFDAWMVLMD